MYMIEQAAELFGLLVLYLKMSQDFKRAYLNLQ